MIRTRNTLIVLRKAFGYFTIWVLILGLFYHMGNLQEYYFDILFLHLLMSLLSLYVTYVHPKKIMVDLELVKFDIIGNKLIIVDLIFHHLPTILIILTGGVKNKSFIFPLLPLLYRFLNNPNVRYGLDDIVGFIGYIFLLIIYLVF
tara:strand:- start:3896 stop:4333 length:438 start_codon:yes stop_codon:yes gene_type:complete